MDKYKETFETWNKIALLYQEKFMDLDLYNDTYDFICNSILKVNSKILEIGCGPGNITKYLLCKRPDFDILGIDIADKMVELAKINNLFIWVNLNYSFLSSFKQYIKSNL